MYDESHGKKREPNSLSSRRSKTFNEMDSIKINPERQLPLFNQLDGGENLIHLREDDDDDEDDQDSQSQQDNYLEF